MSPVREACLLYAKTREHRAKIERAERVIVDALSLASSWYVALSGGKDSTCVLDLVRRQAPETPAVTSISRWRLPETTAYLESVPNLALVADDESHGLDWAANWDSQEQAAKEMPAATWTADHPQRRSLGRSEAGCFLGLRADENRTRRLLLRSRGPLYFCETTGKHHCHPLAWWTVQDVWAYVLSREIPYSRAYDVLDHIGVPLERQRIGEFAIDRALGYGQLAILKRGWPQVWNQYAAAHPEARAYV